MACHEDHRLRLKQSLARASRRPDPAHLLPGGHPPSDAETVAATAAAETARQPRHVEVTSVSPARRAVASLQGRTRDPDVSFRKDAPGECRPHAARPCCRPLGGAPSATSRYVEDRDLVGQSPADRDLEWLGRTGRAVAPDLVKCPDALAAAVARPMQALGPLAVAESKFHPPQTTTSVCGGCVSAS